MSETLSAVLPKPARSAGAPVLTVVLESDRPLAGGVRLDLRGVDLVRLGRGERRAVVRAQTELGDELGLTVADPRMSVAHARVVALGGRWVIEDLGSKNGTFVNGAATRRAVLADGDLVELGQTLMVFRFTEPGCDLDSAEASARAPAPGLATLSAALADTFARLARAAASTVPVLIVGETGTGKELAARAVHTLSRRRGALVAVNCGALPDALVESELFGHKRGAFSGALEDRPGLVRSADGGTLFLDEIGDLPLGSQAALLRVLQESEVTPVGAVQPARVDLRVVAATHHDLEARVHEGRFRADLLARLGGFACELPPLRARREDLGLLSAALLLRLAPDRRDVCLSPAAARALLRHDWPANVRELERALAGALALSPDGRIELEHLPAALGDPATPDEVPPAAEDEVLRAELATRLRRHGGNVSAVAREMGKDRKQIQRWMKRLQLR